LQLQAADRLPASDAARAKIINEFKKVKPQFQATLADAAVTGADHARSVVFNDLARQGAQYNFTRFSPQVEKTLRTHSFTASSRTMNRLTGDVMQNLTESYRQGIGIKPAADRLNAVFTNMKGYETERIARTEIHSGQCKGAQLTMKELGVTFEQWWTAADEAVRESHVWLHGMITRLEDPFPNGLMFPGDTSGALEEFINCRCRPVAFIMPQGYGPPPGRTYFYENEIVPTVDEGDNPLDMINEESLEKLRAEIENLPESEQLAKIESHFLKFEDKMALKGFDKKQIADQLLDYNYGVANQPAWLQSGGAWVKQGVAPYQQELVKGPLKGGINKGVDWLANKVHPALHKKVGSPSLDIFPKMVRGPQGREVFHRASYQHASQTIAWSGDGGSKTFIHEYAHHLHTNNPKVTKTVKRFYYERTKNETLKTIYAGTDEVGYRDKFIDLYSGRLYKTLPGGTEVISRGMEEMHRSPAKFLEKAPSHFNLTYAIMRGLIR